MAVRIADPVETIDDLAGVGLDLDGVVELYRNMILTRGIEERGHRLYRQGKIPGSFYTGRGNEGAAVATGTAMRPEDVGTPTQRDMGVHVVRGLEPWRILAQYMGRADAPMRGREGNVHLGVAELGTVAMVSHMGAMAPVAVGMALAFRIREEARVSVTWFGEGASARGDVHEAMNFAGVRSLPVVFICDNNQWAYSTPAALELATEHVADRAEAYGFGGVVVDGTDALAVYREARQAFEGARAGLGPALLECVTLRMEGHGAHDDASYVPRELLDEWAEKDPIARLKAWLLASGSFNGDDDAALNEEVKRVLADAVERAEASPPPSLGPLDGVYATEAGVLGESG